MIITFPNNRWFVNKIWTTIIKAARNMGSITPCPCIQKSPCVPDICHVGNLPDQPKVIIIGAGLAGLSAAQRLIQCGINNVIILEAAPRPGGRIYTCDCDRAPVDLGAQWIYGGCSTNMIFNLACQEGLIKHPIDSYSPYRGIYVTSDGDAIKDYVREKAIREFDVINTNIKDLYRTGRGVEEKISLWEYFNKSIKLALKNKFYEGEREFVSKVMYGLTNDIKARLGKNLNKIPARKYGANTEIPGGYTAIKKGFTSLLIPMLNMIPKESIMFKKAVRVVKWKHAIHDQKRAEVYCCDGSIYEADFVICTVSLGVLKRHHEELFCPCLPQFKLDAIKKLGFGNVIKIFFEYKKPFWIPTEGKFRLSWSKNEMESEHWINSIGLIEEAPSCGKSLLVTIGGEEANCLETVSASQVVESITKTMRKFLQNQSIPYPKNMLRSNWGHNAFTIGAVTYLGEDSLPSHIKELASPLPGINESVAPVLLFAGEATATGHYSTVQGARLSGIREAERILIITKRFKGKPKADSFTSCV